MLGDLQFPVANPESSLLYLSKVVAPMETALSILGSILAFLISLLILLTIFAIPIGVCATMAIASGSGKWESEDQIQYEHFNPHVKLARKFDRKQSTPLQTPDPAVTVDKKPDKAAVPDDLGKTKLVHSVMEKQAYYCREDQSVEEAQKIMREHGLQYLPVVDSNLRIVGVVRRHY